MGFQHFSYRSQEVQFVTTIVLHGRCRYAVNLLSGMQNKALFLDMVPGFICLNQTLHTVLLAVTCLHSTLEKYKPVSHKVLGILLRFGGLLDL